MNNVRQLIMMGHFNTVVAREPNMKAYGVMYYGHYAAYEVVQLVSVNSSVKITHQLPPSPKHEEA